MGPNRAKQLCLETGQSDIRAIRHQGNETSVQSDIRAFRHQGNQTSGQSDIRAIRHQGNQDNVNYHTSKLSVNLDIPSPSDYLVRVIPGQGLE